MAKLVVLTEGMTGRAHELTADKTTVGRVEDNTFQIPESSVSSHHCEVLLQGDEVKVRDLNSTNGTFINEQQVTEAVLKPGQILRLGKIEMRLETGAPTAPAKKTADLTMAMARGVSLNELEQGPRGTGLEAAGKGFSKKDDKANRIFRISVIVVMVVIIAVLAYLILKTGKPSP
jgi:pSer/pThr/pTyr-binding forkhead associated (FHA) protein